MGFWNSAKKIMSNPKNLLAAAASPFTAGASLAFLEDNSGNSVLGELTGSNAAKAANKKNIELQKQTNDRTIELANTAHQREVADLKAAGLNPVLSAGGSGAATPTLGTANVENTMPGGYLAQAGQVANVANLFSSAKQMNAQAKLLNAQAKYAPQIAQSEIAKNNADTTLATTTAANAGTKTTAMINDENLAKTWWGRNISPVLRDIFGGSGAASGAVAGAAVSQAATSAKKIKPTKQNKIGF